MSSGDAVITITARDLSKAAFDAARASLKELDNDTKTSTTSMRASLNQFAKDNEQSFRSVGQAAGLAVVAIAATAAAVIALGQRGSDVKDVSDAFDQFAGAGSLPALRDGVGGLISNFDLMKSMAPAMSAGFKLNAADAYTMARAAWVLSDAQGKDLKESYDTIANAMATGKVASLAALGLNVEQKGAALALKSALDAEGEAMSTSATRAAARQAAMEAMRSVVLSAGDQELDFGEKLTRAQVGWQNMLDSMGVAISTSPVVGRAMDAIGDALESAFGANQTKTIQTLTTMIGEMAIAAVGAAQFIVSSAQSIGSAYFTVRTAFDTLIAAYNAKEIASVQETVNSYQKLVDQGVKGAEPHLQTLKIRLEYLKGYSQGLDKDATQAEASNEKLRASAQSAADFLAKLKADMEALAKQGASNETIAKRLARATDDLSVSHGGLSAAAEKARKKAMEFHLELDGGVIPTVQRLGKEIAIVSPPIDQFSIKLDQNAIPAVQAFAFNIDMVPPKLAKVSNAFTKTFNEIPDILSRAFEGGGGIGGALQSIAVKFGTDFGKTLSDSIAKSIKAKGSVFTGSSIGAALGMGGLAAGTAIASGASTGQQIGSVASTAMSVGMAAKAAGVATAGSVAFAAYTAGAGLAVIAAYKIWKAMNDGRKVMQDYYKTFQGGGDELRTRMLALGDAGEVLWKKLTQQTGKGDKAGAKAVIDEINTALAKNAETVGKLTTAQNGAMAGLIATSGTYRALPAAMKPYIDQLEAAGRITKENADLLRSMSGAADFGHMKDLASQFGIELDSLGPKFQQAQLTATATGIISAFDELIQGGADYNGVLVGMQDEISSVVQNSIKFGTEIPANMKPWIEQLAQSGRLLDENGDKIEDVSGLKFGEEIKVGLGDVVDKLQEMIDLMKDGLPAAARAAAGGISTELARIRVPRITIPVDAGDEGGGIATGVADESRSAFGSSRSLLRGFNPKTGQVAFAGAASSGGGQWVAAPIHVDGVRLAEVVLRRQPEVLGRYRVRR